MAEAPKQTVENPGHYEEPEDGQMVEITDLALMTSAEIDKQITTARAYPRSLKKFRDDVTELATLDEDVARSCIYVVPRDGKTIEGPSARFAEILVSCWGNNRSGGRVVAVDEEFVTGQGFFFDLEKNTAITYEVKRRITDKRGNRYSADMIVTTGNAATSIAHRNAALKGIPKALWSYALDRARAVVAGNQETLTTRRVKMMKELGLQGATPDKIYGLIGVKGIDDITTEHMVTLGGIYTAIKEGDISVENAFSAERMRQPGEMVPPRPNQSEFDRKTESTAKGDGRKTAKAKTEVKSETKTAIDGGDQRPESPMEGEIVAGQGAMHPDVVDDDEAPEHSAAWEPANKMLIELGEAIGKADPKEIAEYKRAGRVNIDTFEGLTDDERDVLRGQFTTLILTAQVAASKKGKR